MSTSAFLKKIFNQPEVVEDTAGLCGLNIQPSVREIHSSNVLTTVS